MACFLVPVTEAVAVTIAKHFVRKNEVNEKTGSAAGCESAVAQSEGRIPFSGKLGWLSNMLWGGSALLAFEHLWHGEVTPWFPFLTAAQNPSDLAGMFHEMTTVGIAMAVSVTLVWTGMLAVTRHLEKKEAELLSAKSE